MKKLLISLVVLFTFAPGKAQDQKELMEKIEALQAQVDSLQQRVDTLTRSHAFLDFSTRLNILDLELNVENLEIAAKADLLNQLVYHKDYLQERYYIERKNYDAYEKKLPMYEELHQGLLDLVGSYPQYDKFTSYEKYVLKHHADKISIRLKLYNNTMKRYKLNIEAYGKLR